MKKIKIVESNGFIKTTVEEKSFKKSMKTFFKPKEEIDIKLATGDLIAFRKPTEKKSKQVTTTTESLVEENN